MMTLRQLSLSALPLLAGPLLAQQRPPTPPTPPTPPDVREIRAPLIQMREALTSAFAVSNPDAPRLGITLGEADTAGVSVSEVAANGPAAAAGLTAGDRLVSIDGISLRMDPLDAADPALEQMMHRRIQRAMADKKAGDNVTLRVASAGAARTVTITTVTERSLRPVAERALAGNRVAFNSRPRATLGVTLGNAPSKRDTLGVLIIGLSADGPAERAGLVEGDRIARINGVDVRVPREDAGEATLSRARVERLQKVLRELEPGAEVTLSVVSAGRTRELRVTTVETSTLPGSDALYYTPWSIEMPVIPNAGELPRVRELRVEPGTIREVRVAPVRIRVENDR